MNSRTGNHGTSPVLPVPPPLVKVFRLSLCFALLTALTPARAAEVPRTIAFQANLKTATGAPVNGDVSVTLSLYDVATDGAALWTDVKTVTAANGVISTALGEPTPFPATVLFDRPYWVGMKVGADAEMAPRLPLQTMPYAMALPGVSNASGRILVHGKQVILDLSENGGGQLVLSHDVGDNKVYLEGASSDGTGSASEILFTGLNAHSLPKFSVIASLGYFKGKQVILDLSENGGGQLVLSHDVGDNKVYLEGASSAGTGSAAEIVICGYKIKLPKFTVDATTSSFTGDVSCNTLTLTSSNRFKQNIRPLAGALNTISGLQGVSYTWDDKHGGRKDIGFIAEDVAKVVPELVTMEDNGVDAKGMDYAHLTALLVEGIKELKAENADLKTRLERLEQKENNR